MLILGRRDHSCAELKSKLHQRGHNGQEIDRVIDKCRRYNYLDDARYARQRTTVLRRKGYGPRRIRGDLLTKGIASDLVALVFDEVYGFDRQRKDCRGVLAKKLKNASGKEDPTRLRQKLHRFLLNRGFTPETVQEELALALPF